MRYIGLVFQINPKNANKCDLLISPAESHDLVVNFPAVKSEWCWRAYFSQKHTFGAKKTLFWAKKQLAVTLEGVCCVLCFRCARFQHRWEIGRILCPCVRILFQQTRPENSVGKVISVDMRQIRSIIRESTMMFLNDININESCVTPPDLIFNRM